VIDLFGVHALEKTKLIGDGAGVRHQSTRPCSALAVASEGLHRCEQELAGGITGHGAEPFAGEVTFGNRLTVESGEVGFVIEEVDVGRATVHEEVDDPLRLRGVMGAGPTNRITEQATRWRCCGEAEHRGESGGAHAGTSLAEEGPPGDAAGVFADRIGDGHRVSTSSRFRISVQMPVNAAWSFASRFCAGAASPTERSSAAAPGRW
jgi:hypothetical protein